MLNWQIAGEMLSILSDKNHGRLTIERVSNLLDYINTYLRYSPRWKNDRERLMELLASEFK